MFGRLAVWGLVVCLPMVAAADEALLSEPPDALVKLRWSSQFAAFIASECAQFAVKEVPDERMTAFIDGLVQDGVDLKNQQDVYADTPAFDGESVKWLFARSGLRDMILPEKMAFCDVADVVYHSDMLTGAMLRRVEPMGNS